jgi:hypothetical protein
MIELSGEQVAIEDEKSTTFIEKERGLLGIEHRRPQISCPVSRLVNDSLSSKPLILATVFGLHHGGS